MNRKMNAVILVFVLMMISMVTISPIFAETKPSRVVQLDRGWSYAKGLISPEQAVNTPWTNIDDLSKEVMKTDEVGNLITYRMILPSIDCTRCSIYIGFIYRDFRIFINGNELIRYGDVDKPNLASQSLRDLMFYEFDLIQGERNELLVQVKSDVSNIGFLAPIQIGDPYLINNRINENNFENMIVNILVGFTGIVVLVVYFPIRRERLYLLFGLTCIVASAYLLARNDLFLKWSGTPRLNYHFEYLGLLLLPTLLTLYMQHFYKEYKRTIMIINSFMGVFWLFIFIRYLVFDISLHMNVFLGQLLILFLMSFNLAVIFRNAWKGNQEARTVSWIFMISFLFVIINVVNVLISDRRDINLVQYAVLFFVIAQMYILVQRIQEMNQRLENWNTVLEQQVAERMDKVRALLNQSAQGFLTVGRDYIVENEYSSACERFFGKSPAGSVITQLLWSNQPKDAEMIIGLMEELFHAKDAGQMMPYFGLFPSEIRVGKYILECTVRPVFEIDRRLKKLTFILDDVTEQRALANQLKEEEMLMRMIVSVLSHPRDYKELVADYRKFVADDVLSVSNERGYRKEHFQYVLRMTHTFKGNFAQFGSFLLVEQLHQIESTMLDVEFEQSDQWSAILPKLPWLNALDEEIMRMQEVVPLNWLDTGADEVTVQRSELVSLKDRIHETLIGPIREELSDAIEKLYLQPFRELLEPLANYTTQLAGRMEKWIDPVVIHGGLFEVDHEKWRNWAKSLVHIVRNQLDHGIEDIDTRLEHEKTEQGKIDMNIQFDHAQKQIIVAFRDDGAGIDYERLRAKIVDKGLLTEAVAQDKSEAELNAYLFVDEITTRDQASEFSGRGVGLAAVKVETEKLGGRIEVSSVRGEGTEMRFVFQLNS